MYPDMETLSRHKGVEAAAESLKRNPNVTGVWIRLDTENPGFELIIHQNSDETAQLQIHKPNGEIEIHRGTIIHRRLQTGYPIRQELFVSESGDKKVILRENEF